MRFLLDSLQGKQKSFGIKKKIEILPAVPTKKAQNRTRTYLLLEVSTGKLHTKFPGELAKFIRKIGGNYNSVMGQRSQFPTKDISIWIIGKTHDKVKWVLLAATTSMVN